MPTNFLQKIQTAAAFTKAASIWVWKNFLLAKKRFAEYQAEQQRKFREERAAFEKKREETKQYVFWKYRGKAYGISKTRYQDGDYIYPRTMLYLDMGDEKSPKFQLDRCDFAVGNGHDVLLIFARGADTDSGWCIRAINLSSRNFFALDQNMERVRKQTGLDQEYGLKRLNRDLEKYTNSL